MIFRHHFSMARIMAKILIVTYCYCCPYIARSTVRGSLLQKQIGLSLLHLTAGGLGRALGRGATAAALTASRPFERETRVGFKSELRVATSRLWRADQEPRNVYRNDRGRLTSMRGFMHTPRGDQTCARKACQNLNSSSFF